VQTPIARSRESHPAKGVRPGEWANSTEAEFANHRYERHFHGELVLAITESGTARINCWGRWFTAGPGDIFVSNPNDPQAAMTFWAAWKYRAFYLTRHALDQLAHVLDLKSFPRLSYGVFQSPALH
jgi:hypothetical protein